MNRTRRGLVALTLALAPGLAAAERVATVAFVASRARGTLLPPALASRGWTVGRNLRWEPRIATADAGIEAAAREALALKPDLVIAFLRESVEAVVRANPAMAVVAALHDPVIEGFARSLAQPGGRVTGIALSSPDGVKMTFRILASTLPRLKRIHALGPQEHHAWPTVVAVRGAITAEKGIAFVEHSPRDTAAALRIVSGIRDPGEEAVVLGSALPGLDYDAFSAAVLRARVAAIDMTGGMKAGSLLGAGMYHADMWGRLAAIADQVLRGANPATIPFEQPTHSALQLDMRTSRAIGVPFPPEVLMRATKVIE
jgi:putative ABC transport system substrate-binding protein